MSRRIVLAILLIGAVLACERSHHADKPAAVAKAEEVEKSRMNQNVFAADGMCSDKLVKHFEGEKRLLTGIERTLHERVKIYKAARAAGVKHSFYRPNHRAEKSAADALMYTFSFWRDTYLPFHQRYGNFWCVRRRDMLVISSAELERGIDDIWETVKHLGPLPPAQHFVIGD